ncbi:MAG: hypothetical protein ACT4OK_12140 [Gemmobacter sp.]
MFIVTPRTVWNPAALEVRQLPRRIFGRVTLWPRRGGTAGLWLRILFEVELWRYLGVLMPFAAAAAILPRYALAIAQAPLLMFIAVHLAETKLMRLTPEARARLVSQAEAERGLDLLRVRARAILTRIAAGRGMARGALHLVVEQSELARIAPLTFVSVQWDEGPQVLALTAAEEALIRDGLFAPGLDARLLQRINLAEGEFLRDEVLEVGQVSAHARLAAMMVVAAPVAAAGPGGFAPPGPPAGYL